MLWPQSTIKLRPYTCLRFPTFYKLVSRGIFGFRRATDQPRWRPWVFARQVNVSDNVQSLQSSSAEENFLFRFPG